MGYLPELLVEDEAGMSREQLWSGERERLARSSGLCWLGSATLDALFAPGAPGPEQGKGHGPQERAKQIERRACLNYAKYRTNTYRKRITNPLATNQSRVS